MEWLVDSGCTEHITLVKSDLHNYKELNHLGKADIANGIYITIKGNSNWTFFVTQWQEVQQEY